MTESNGYAITKKESLANSIYLMDVKAPRVSKNCYPGQFVIVKMDEKGERIPLTICDYDREDETVTIVFQAIGTSTQMMSHYEVGDVFRDFTGPLGHKSELIDMPSEELSKLNILFVAGGVGAAPVYPQVKWMKENGYDVDVIIGARNKELIILENRMKEYSRNLYITTDDGSYGFHGNVNDCIKDLVNNQGKHYDLVIAIGPMIMMKFVCILTKELGIKTIVSMNPVMVDGTGMCGACRLTVGNEVKFACVDGPEFDGHLVKFDEAMKRMQMYKSEEGKKVLREKEGATSHHPNCECH
jgi:2-polyprenylphenol hydroxylase and related flavodoxin oxidoreductases